MCSIKEEDLTSSVDFEFYDPGGHKEDNVIFNKVCDKPPSGRHRSISTPTKVCYENSTYNETNKSNGQQQQTNSLEELELTNRKEDSVLLMNGTRKVDSHHTTTTTNNVEEDDRIVLVVSPEENDFQSGLDVSISDDTDDDDDDDDDKDLLVDEITDDEDENATKEQLSLQQDVEDLDSSWSESRTNGLEMMRRLKSDTLLHGIGVPSLHNRLHHQYGSVSCSSESSFSVNNDLNESDLSSLDDDDDDDNDEDEDCCSDDGVKSTDDEDVDNSTNNDDAVVGSMKTLKHGPTPPRKFFHINELSYAERYSLHKNRNDKLFSSPDDMNCNCNNIEDEECSSASEMTDVSPLASSADNSPTIIRKSKVKKLSTSTTKDTTSVCKKSSSPPTLNNGKNGFYGKIKKASGYGDMDMNVIMQAVEEISKEDEEKWKSCNSKILSSSSLSPTRKRNNNNKTNITYPKERARQIEKENERLLSQLLKLSSSKSYKVVGYKVPLKPKISHSAINRQREQRRIDKENEAFLRRLQFAKASHGLSRDEQLEEYNSKYVKYPRNKSTHNGSPFKRPFTATSSSSRNSIISLTTTDTNSIPLSKTTVYHHQSTPAINNRPEWVSKW